jgi:hypothetical protein
MVSVDSFFHPVNKPPKEYQVADYILEKPGRINLTQVNASAPKQPLAGRLTEIGEQILLIGSQKAKFICTGDWRNEYARLNNKGKKNSAQSTFRPGFEKITKYNAFDYVEKPTLSMQRPKMLETERLQKALKFGRETPVTSPRF